MTNQSRPRIILIITTRSCLILIPNRSLFSWSFFRFSHSKSCFWSQWPSAWLDIFALYILQHQFAASFRLWNPASWRLGTRWFGLFSANDLQTWKVSNLPHDSQNLVDLSSQCRCGCWKIQLRISDIFLILSGWCSSWLSCKLHHFFDTWVLFQEWLWLCSFLTDKYFLKKCDLIDAHWNFWVQLIVFESNSLEQLSSLMIVLRRPLLNQNWFVKLQLLIEATWALEFILKFRKDFLRSID